MPKILQILRCSRCKQSADFLKIRDPEDFSYSKFVCCANCGTRLDHDCAIKLAKTLHFHKKENDSVVKPRTDFPRNVDGEIVHFVWHEYSML